MHSVVSAPLWLYTRGRWGLIKDYFVGTDAAGMLSVRLLAVVAAVCYYSS